MAVVFYPAIIERAGLGFSVFFPDLPGCTSAGSTLHEAALAAENAVIGHLATLAEHGDILPEPSALDEIERDRSIDEVARLLVRALQPGRILRVDLFLEESLIRQIDRVSENRSRFLADAAKMALAARTI
ncbi:type II toxin-antitoxin system HicB family antitoxin [Sphingomonas crocodyli]|uniref:HicB family protein n=1 Tax=Sphingomonas crocodyli TaxID=1979270 RepID=A0A437LXZ1_9SPHN|nr:type II toxin-antitoxin system HicB family antitoxin [Sphingomonas crocodyli]RVT90196.1 HicB family protein [Sphingomonas crocodyli]